MLANCSRSARFSALVVSLLVPAANAIRAEDKGAPPKPSLSDYHGKWEILIANSGDTFQSCMLDIGEEAGKLRAQLLWKWASVSELPADALHVTEDGWLEVRRRDWPKPLRLRRLGDAIQGSRELKGGSHEFVTGRLARWNVDASGVWSITAGRDGNARGTLTLRSLGADRYRAEARNDEGHEIDIKNVAVAGNRLIMDFVADEGKTPLSLVGEIRADQFVGKIRSSDGQVEEPAYGKRDRRWGKPVDLLAHGLDGWRPRDPRRKFGWKVEDGVLTNSPPDVDVVSKAEFRDFKVELEYKVEREGGKRSNSGIYIRGRYEVQILDDWHEDSSKRRVQRHGNGAVYSRIVPESFASAAPGKWQHYEITVIDRFLTVKLNGQTIVNNRQLVGITGGALLPFENDPGPLMLQGDHGKIEYRNIRVTPALPSGI